MVLRFAAGFFLTIGADVGCAQLLPAQVSDPSVAVAQKPPVTVIVEAPEKAPEASTPVATATDALKFTIRRFVVEGNTLIEPKVIIHVLSPYLGEQKDFGDVQHALEALQSVHQKIGYGSVRVILPEQELERGEIHLLIIEPRLKRITVEGNRYFSEKNARNSVPSLQPGTIPNSIPISRSLKVANESPSKQTQVLLRADENDDEIDAAIKVADDKPTKYSVALDNSGTDDTGRFRLRFAYQNANLWDRDNTLTLQYITDPENPNKVEVWAAGYHIPLYRWGDSIDLVAGYSNVNSGTVQDLFSVSGAGLLMVARYNQNLDRIGDYEHKLIYGLDYRAYQNDVTTVGSSVALVPDITVHPASFTYSGTLHQSNAEFGFYGGVSQNIFPGGNDDANSDFQGPTAEFPDGARKGAKAGYRIWSMGANYTRALGDWQLRAVFNGQYSDAALVVGEQFGLGGASNVRGFEERQYSDDKGYQSNFEFYTPDIASKIGYASGHLRFLAFYDTGTIGRNFQQPGEKQGLSVDSAGIGLRFGTRQIFSLKMDFAYVLHDGGGDPTAGKPDGRRGSSMLHANAVWVF